MFKEAIKYNKPDSENTRKRERLLRQVSYRTVVDGGMTFTSAEISKMANFTED